VKPRTMFFDNGAIQVVQKPEKSDTASALTYQKLKFHTGMNFAGDELVAREIDQYLAAIEDTEEKQEIMESSMSARKGMGY